MIPVESHNNSGVFRTKKSFVRQKNGRLRIRHSKIYKSLINNNNNPQEQNFTINYRSQLKHRRIRRKILNGGGDEKLITSLSSIQPKHIDFKELEQIFDNAIRNNLPLELYKEKPQTKELILKENINLHQSSLPKIQSLIKQNPIETRIDLSTEEIQCCFITNIKQHKILSVIIFVTLSALLGFFTVFIFIK